MRRLISLLSLCCLLLWPGAAMADNITVTMNSISDQGIGESIGTIEAQDGPDGLVIRPSLQGLREGEHGFHLHAGESCEVARNSERLLLQASQPSATGIRIKPTHTRGLLATGIEVI